MQQFMILVGVNGPLATHIRIYRRIICMTEAHSMCVFSSGIHGQQQDSNKMQSLNLLLVSNSRQRPLNVDPYLVLAHIEQENNGHVQRLIKYCHFKE